MSALYASMIKCLYIEVSSFIQSNFIVLICILAKYNSDRQTRNCHEKLMLQSKDNQRDEG